MPIVRLLTILLTISICAASANAQSSQQNFPGGSSADNDTAGFSIGKGDSLPGFGAVPPLQSSSPENRILVDRFQLQPFPRVFVLPHMEARADTICYSIRSYLVVRDSPYSDSTHPGDYSTCQPSTRFRVKSVEDWIELLRR